MDPGVYTSNTLWSSVYMLCVFVVVVTQICYKALPRLLWYKDQPRRQFWRYAIMCLPINQDTHTHIMQTPADTYYELSVEKVCQFYAVLLLRQAGKVS